MATPKTWTATDVEQGKLTIIRRGATLQVERRYEFLDNEGLVISDIAGGRVTAEVQWTSIPPGVQAALLAIDTWTYNQILAQEGME